MRKHGQSPEQFELQARRAQTVSVWVSATAALTGGRPPWCDWLSPMASSAVLAAMPAIGPAAATSHMTPLFFNRLSKGVMPPKLPICTSNNSNRETHVTRANVRETAGLAATAPSTTPCDRASFRPHLLPTSHPIKTPVKRVTCTFAGYLGMHPASAAPRPHTPMPACHACLSKLRVHPPAGWAQSRWVPA